MGGLTDEFSLLQGRFCHKAEDIYSSHLFQMES